MRASSSCLTQIYKMLRNDFCGVLWLSPNVRDHFFLYSSLIVTIRSKLPFQSNGIRLFMWDTWTWMICLLSFSLLPLSHCYNFCFEAKHTIAQQRRGINPKNKDGLEIINALASNWHGAWKCSNETGASNNKIVNGNATKTHK